MKAKNLLKVLFTAVAVFAFSATFAQELNDGTDNLPNLSEATDKTSFTDHVTEGYRVPYYVTPDPILNGGYAGPPYIIGTEDQGFGSSWSWDFNQNNTVGDGAATATIYNGGFDGTTEYGYDHPYVEVEWTRSGAAAAGSGEQAYIEVREDGPAGVTCNGEWNWLPVQVYAEPEFVFIDETNGHVTGGDGVIELCDDGTGITQDILIAEIIDNGIPIAGGEAFENGNFKFRLDRDVWIVDEAGNEETMVSESIDEIVTVTAAFETDFVLFTGADLSAIDNNTDGNNQITRYRFDFGSTIDAANANGITDPVLRKSQYLANHAKDDQAWDYKTNTGTDGDMVTFITYPSPNTGNIYFVPNDFDL